ncbi:unnamed protein product [Rhizophagus irregularis]|nr:unnamed protein product [Rhizophagus irregularis]
MIEKKVDRIVQKRWMSKNDRKKVDRSDGCPKMIEKKVDKIVQKRWMSKNDRKKSGQNCPEAMDVQNDRKKSGQNCPEAMDVQK